jgi:hypothetical protein
MYIASNEELLHKERFLFYSSPDTDDDNDDNDDNELPDISKKAFIQNFWSSSMCKATSNSVSLTLQLISEG